MKNAYLYIRVSTDEQADKGYSQRNQDEVLRRYCKLNQIEVHKVIFEDYSAKTFQRPAWTKLLADLKKRKGQVDLVLFTKWDRFSRNTSDAYQMISTLKHLNTEPQAIEQPLDLSVPENKMMLAFYLAAPEVENDRRALNTFHGMRRAKKEGRWMAAAPIGYKNKTTEDGKKYIASDPSTANIIKWAFEKMGEGNFNVQQIWKEAVSKGLRCSKNNFWSMIHNPVYCGKIFIPKFKDEEAHLVHGQHEPLITEALFYDIQDTINGRKKKPQKTKIVVDENVPLKGFLICPKCGWNLTASASKGKYKYYHYYHCKSDCGIRYKAELANGLFLEELKKYIADPAIVILYKEIIRSEFDKHSKAGREDISQVNKQITAANERIRNARELLLCGDIDAADYKTIKKESEDKLTALDAKLTSLLTIDHENIDSLAELGVSLLSRLDKLYLEADVTGKREIVSSMFPEKIVFDGKEHRTPRVNEVAIHIYQISNALNLKKDGTNRNNLRLSHQVARRGIEPLFLE